MYVKEPSTSEVGDSSAYSYISGTDGFVQESPKFRWGFSNNVVWSCMECFSFTVQVELKCILCDRFPNSTSQMITKGKIFKWI